MSYEPLHHKYRPQTFAELVGQEAVATTLTSALRQQRIAPAYLFTGARGTGKTSSARILAKSLNCLQSDVPTDKPCGKCDVCRTIARGSALDVIEIDAASNTGVDNIRELIERAQFAPVQCRYKVYIIDEVHMLSTAAFNALLKTLEEPPDRVVFVLATTDPQRVLPTIISRCQRFDFRRIPLEAMVEHLGKIADKEAIDATPEAVQLVAQISQGGLRDAEALLDQLSLLEGQITAERVWDLVGAVPERDLLTLVQAIAQDDATAVLDRARRLMDRGREPLIVLQNLASFYRDLLIAKTSPDRADLVAITPPTWAEMCEFAQQLDFSTILQGQQHLRGSEVQVKNTTQPRLWLEVTLMGLLPSAIGSLESGVSRQALRKQESRSSEERGGLPLRSTPQPTKSSAPSSTPPVNAPKGVAAETRLEQAKVEQTEPAPQSTQSLGSAEPESVRPQFTEPTGFADSDEDDNNLAIDSEIDDEINDEAVTQDEAEAEESHSIDLEAIWQEVIAQIRFRGTQVLLQQQGCLLAFDGHEARIGIKSQPLFKMAKEKLPDVEAAFEAIYQQKVRISLEVISATAEGRSMDAQKPTDSLLDRSPAKPKSAPPRRPTVREANAPSDTSPGSRSSSPDYPQSALPPSIASDTATPTGASPLPPWQEEDEVQGAARSVAQFFNGEIVSLEGELPSEPDRESLSIEQDEPDLDEEDEDEVDGDPDDDVPF